MKLSACGNNLTKTVFQIHGVDFHGKACLRRQLRRAEMLTFLSSSSRASLVWKPAAEPITGRAS